MGVRGGSLSLISIDLHQKESIALTEHVPGSLTRAKVFWIL